MESDGLKTGERWGRDNTQLPYLSTYSETGHSYLPHNITDRRGDASSCCRKLTLPSSYRKAILSSMSKYTSLFNVSSEKETDLSLLSLRIHIARLLYSCFLHVLHMRWLD